VRAKRAILLLLGAAAALAGCGEPASRPKPAAPAPAAAPAPDTAATIAARKIAFDGRTGGYLKVKIDAEAANAPRHEDEPLAYWIYDLRWTAVGFYTAGGQTFRCGRRPGSLEPLGTLPRDIALRTLLHANPDSIVDLLPIDAPRTLDSDAQAAREAAAAAAKEKEKAAAQGGAAPAAPE
jgi:hypothetical protein